MSGKKKADVVTIGLPLSRRSSFQSVGVDASVIEHWQTRLEEQRKRLAVLYGPPVGGDDPDAWYWDLLDWQLGLPVGKIGPIQTMHEFSALVDRRLAVREHQAGAGPAPQADEREPPAAKKRGRPGIPMDRKLKATRLLAKGKSNREAARVLYGTETPSDRQVKDAPKVLAHFLTNLPTE